jgi:hypothetical protein
MPTDSCFGAAKVAYPDLFRIECDDIGPHPGLEDTAIIETQTGGRETGELSNGLFKAHAAFFVRIFAQHAWEGAVGARLRELFAEQTLRRGAFAIVSQGVRLQPILFQVRLASIFTKAKLVAERKQQLSHQL